MSHVYNSPYFPTDTKVAEGAAPEFAYEALELTTDSWYLVVGYNEYDETTGILKYQYAKLRRELGDDDHYPVTYNVPGMDISVDYITLIGLIVFAGSSGTDIAYEYHNSFVFGGASSLFSLSSMTLTAVVAILVG